MKKVRYAVKYGITVTVIALLVIFFSLWLSDSKYIKKETLAPTFSATDHKTFIIDPGHGGEDSGAVATDGTLEKDLNLEISRALFLLYELNGNKAAMTRQTDTLLYDRYGDLENYRGQKKIYDLKNRVKITMEYKDPVYVGIHMNNFSNSKYKGLQVYFSRNDKSSRLMAEAVQKNVSLYIQKDNKRSVKQADSSIYVLDKLSCPSVLIECGFMSNEEELTLYKSKEYRRDVSLVIFLSTLVSCIDKVI